jgi:hypothetical protein
MDRTSDERKAQEKTNKLYIIYILIPIPSRQDVRSFKGPTNLISIQEILGKPKIFEAVV